MNMALDKRQVERQFERAARSYNQAAGLQQSIIETLLDEMSATKLSARHIVDLGCGTGLGLKALAKQFPAAELLGVDLSQAMLDQAVQACPSASVMKADIESLPLEDDSFDLVFTSSTLQWCDLQTALDQCSRILKPDGYLALATFGPKTHQEWKAAWAEVDQTSHTLEFADSRSLSSCAEQAGFNAVYEAAKTEVLTFESVQHVLQSVKALGATNANSDRQQGLMGKQRFQRFLSAFEATSPAHNLTYEIFYLIGQKQA